MKYGNTILQCMLLHLPPSLIVQCKQILMFAIIVCLQILLSWVFPNRLIDITSYSLNILNKKIIENCY